VLVNKEQVKAMLLACRPGTRDVEDPEVADALQATRQDTELHAWLERQAIFHESVRTELRELPVPADLKARILRQHTAARPESAIGHDTESDRPDGWLARHRSSSVIVPIWWRREVLLAAACLAFALVVTVLWFRPTGEDESFAGFRSRMVGFALREYRMDILTNNLDRVRAYLREHGTPADYVLTAGLEKTPVMGGASLSWQNHPVSMVCFNLPQNQTLYMFVMDEAYLQGRKALSPDAVLQPAHGIMTASWSRQGKVYLIAAPVDQAVLKNKIPGGA
jgi:hypothetical protein